MRHNFFYCAVANLRTIYVHSVGYMPTQGRTFNKIISSSRSYCRINCLFRIRVNPSVQIRNFTRHTFVWYDLDGEITRCLKVLLELTILKNGREPILQMQALIPLCMAFSKRNLSRLWDRPLINAASLHAVLNIAVNSLWCDIFCLCWCGIASG